MNIKVIEGERIIKSLFTHSNHSLESKRLSRHAAKDIPGIRVADGRVPIEEAILKFCSGRHQPISLQLHTPVQFTK